MDTHTTPLIPDPLQENYPPPPPTKLSIPSRIFMIIVTHYFGRDYIFLPHQNFKRSYPHMRQIKLHTLSQTRPTIIMPQNIQQQKPYTKSSKQNLFPRNLCLLPQLPIPQQTPKHKNIVRPHHNVSNGN